MSDHLTACLASDEGNVRTFLVSHGHVYVETLGPFTGGDLVFNTNVPPPSACGGLSGAGPKVVVHTTLPNVT
jgi:hypothetical protein